MTRSDTKVTIYTDGAAEPNPGAGGLGVVLLYGEHRKEISRGFVLTTNNRMELLAVIVGLEALKKPCKVTVYSDSRYVVDSVEKGSVARWQANDWHRSRSEKAKNSDLWSRFLSAYEKHSVELKWVPGHAGIKENERCDQLAVQAAKSSDRIEDTGYAPFAKDSSKEDFQSKGAKVKHMDSGEPCRRCGVKIVKRTPKRKKRKSGQLYYFEWYLFCPGCKSMYMVESAKREYNNSEGLF